MTTVADTDAARVAALGVQWLQRPLAGAVPARSVLAGLLQQPAPDAAGQAAIAQALAPLVADEIAAHGYRSHDLVVLHPATPGLQEALARFDLPHTHDDDEVRYILDGEGVFGFFDTEGRETVVRVRPGDYLRVPAGVEHRFTLTAARRIKALRLFSDTAGWVARYTRRPAAPLGAP
jgi:1,2-dihydroxy-3-keto-5-methylthiopentene dioxygenase